MATYTATVLERFTLKALLCVQNQKREERSAEVTSEGNTQVDSVQSQTFEDLEKLRCNGSENYHAILGFFFVFLVFRDEGVVASRLNSSSTESSIPHNVINLKMVGHSPRAVQDFSTTTGWNPGPKNPRGQAIWTLAGGVADQTVHENSMHALEMDRKQSEIRCVALGGIHTKSAR